MVDQQRLEKFRSEVEAILSVLSARLEGAKDYEDWKTIYIQATELQLTARMALREAGRNES